MKKYKPLRYNGAAVVFSEVPDEVSLAISITGCPRRCPGCHSEYLWEYSGNLLLQDLDALIRRYIGLITCVCFMGGDAENPKELKKCLKRVRRYGLKTALYSGTSYTIEKKYISSIDVRVHSPLNPILRYLDYLKIGPYEKDHGGLDDPNTNQRMIERDPSSKHSWTDITYRFQNKKRERRHLLEQYDRSTQEAPHPPSAEIHQRRLKNNAGVAAGTQDTSHADTHP